MANFSTNIRPYQQQLKQYLLDFLDNKQQFFQSVYQFRGFEQSIASKNSNGLDQQTGFKHSSGFDQQTGSKNSSGFEHQKSVSSSQITETQPIDWSDDAFLKLKQFIVGGKLLRGSLFLMLADQLQAKNSVKSQLNCLQIASAIELTQSAVLIQDDFMDNDTLRRGKPAVFYQYQQQLQNSHFSNSLHMGISMAICLSDLCLFLAFEQLGVVQTTSKIKNSLSAIFSEKFNYTIFGQMQDLSFASNSIEPNDEQIINMYLLKTAHYTLALPLVLSATYTKQNKTTTTNLDKIGQLLGVIFQLIDDKLAIFGNQQTTGKAVGNDVVQDKKTLLRYYLNQQSTNQKIKNYFGKQTLTTDQLDEIIKEMKKLQIDWQIDQLIEQKIQLVKKILPQIKSIAIRQIINSLLDYSLSRIS